VDEQVVLAREVSVSDAEDRLRRASEEVCRDSKALAMLDYAVVKIQDQHVLPAELIMGLTYLLPGTSGIDIEVAKGQWILTPRQWHMLSS
jgi:hypothetical protein